MIKAIKSYFTLKFVRKLFTDTVSGKDVNLYTDCYGDLYMKDSRYGLFKTTYGV